jgi:hypothetical protein
VQEDTHARGEKGVEERWGPGGLFLTEVVLATKRAKKQDKLLLVYVPAEDAEHVVWADPVVQIAATCEVVALVVFADTRERLWLAKTHGDLSALPGLYLIASNGTLVRRLSVSGTLSAEHVLQQIDIALSTVNKGNLTAARINRFTSTGGGVKRGQRQRQRQRQMQKQFSDRRPPGMSEGLSLEHAQDSGEPVCVCVCVCV